MRGGKKTWDSGLFQDVDGPVTSLEHAVEPFERHHSPEDRGQGCRLGHNPGSVVWLATLTCIDEGFVLLNGGPRQPERPCPENRARYYEPWHDKG